MAEYKADEFFHHKRTNGDGIREMNDSELVEFISNFFRCPPNRFCGDYDCKSFDDCHDCWLDWFKQEVDDGDTD